MAKKCKKSISGKEQQRRKKQSINAQIERHEAEHMGKPRWINNIDRYPM